jgi:Glycosyltransferase family 87
VNLRYSDRPRWHTALDAWALAVIVSVLGQIVFRLGTYQWDTIVYWWAGRAFLGGRSPYGAIPGQPSYLHYVYPPITAAVFAPLAHFNVAATKLIWLAAKMLAFWATVRLWMRVLNVRVSIVPPIFLFTFAFGSALIVDFTAGNIVVFEQLILWLAFSSLLARRPMVFAVLVAAVAQFKLMPLFFLGLLLVIEERPQWRPFTVGVVVFGALLMSNAALSTSQVGDFITSMTVLSGETRGWNDPSMLGVMQDLVAQLRGVGLPVPELVKYVLYGAVALVILGFTFRWWQRERERGDVDRVKIILVSLVVYALVMPRMKDYSYVALLPVAWYALSQTVTMAVPVLVVAALVPRPLPQLNLWMPLATQPYIYAPLIGALVAWTTLIGERAKRQDEVIVETASFAA